MAVGRVFISYERSDREYAERIAEALERLGWSVWWDRKLLAGDRFEPAIRKALDEADCVIVVWSRTSVESDWVRDEAGEGAERGVLVPILIDDAEIPLGFRGRHTLHLTDWGAGFHYQFAEVLQAVALVGLRGRRALPDDGPTAPVPPPAPRPAPRQVERDGPRRAIPGEAPVLHDVPAWRRRALAAVVIVAGVAAVAVGLYRARSAEEGAAAGFSPDAVATGGGATGGGSAAPDTRVVPLPASTLPTTNASTGPGVGTLRFVWPGGDCWDIFRGETHVTFHCGASVQPLQAGRYTLKGRGYAVLEPTEVTIAGGSVTTVDVGGAFKFDWPGGDCWDVFRGEQLVTYGCGPSTQALQAGAYEIRGRGYPVFTPFAVRIQKGATTEVRRGGVFEFKWPGGDCWTLFRGDKEVTFGCGASKQALDAGAYRITARGSQVFEPFTINIRVGATTTAP